MADQPKTFDFETFVTEELGGRISGPGASPGTIKLMIPGRKNAQGLNEEIVDFDYKDFFKNEVGVDASQINIKFNSPETAIDDSPLSFIDRVKYETTKTKADKARFLKEKFSADSIKYNPDTGRFLINNNGLWQDADSTGIGGFIGSDGDVIAGAVAGGAIAAKAVAGPLLAATAITGGVASPITAAIGVGATALGAGVGAAMARLGTFAAAKQAGIRTEEDASEIMAELGKEGLLAMAGEVAVPIVKLGAKATAKVLGDSVRKIAKSVTTPRRQREAAYTMEAATSVPFVDNMTWIENPTAVETFQKEIIDWEAQTGGKGYNPVKKRMAEEVQDAVSTVRKNMDSEFRQADEAFRPTLQKLKVDVSPVHNDVVSMVNDLDAEISNIADASSRRHVKRVTDIIKKAVRDEPVSVKQASSNLATEVVEKTSVDMYGTIVSSKVPETTAKNAVGANSPSMVVDWATGGQKSKLKTTLSFNEARTLVSNLDDILEAAGQYNIGPQEITTRAKGQILGLRRKLNDIMIGAIEKESPEVAAKYRAMNSKYAARREWIDDVAISTRDEKIDATVKKLLGPDGGKSVDNAVSALNDSGLNGQKFVDRLFQQRAALNSSKLYRQPTMGHVVLGALRLTSPQRTTPITSKAFVKIKNLSEGVNYLKTLPKEQREAFLQNPDAQRALRQIVLRTIDAESNLPDQLLDSAIQQTAPRNGQE